MKIFKITTILTVGFLVFSGCAANMSSGSTEESTLSDAPDWYYTPPSAPGMLYGIGSAKKQNPSLAKKTATLRARTELAEAVNVKVSSMIKDFMQETGVGENAQALEFTQSVSKAVSSASLQGSIIKQVAPGKDGTIYVLVEYSLEAVRRGAIEEAQRREDAYNEFKADRAFEDLEADLNSMK